MIYIYIIAGILIVVAAYWLASNIEDPVERAGRRGEEVAEDIITNVLRYDDILLTNVELSYDGKRTEADIIVINKNGVFIIEVKNYVGELVGDIDDSEWKKYKTTPGGDVYVKTVRNPIKQVKRQIYIVSSILKERRIKVWVEGYMMLMENNSPVDDKMILRNIHEIDSAIHGTTEQIISKKEIDKIVSILEPKANA